jgi:hypothetical protein
VGGGGENAGDEREGEDDGETHVDWLVVVGGEE